MSDEIEVLKRALEEQKLRAQRDALAAEVERGPEEGGEEKQLRGIQHRRLLCPVSYTHLTLPTNREV